MKNRGILKFAIYSLIILTAIWLRCYQIELRPLHADEGVNHYFTTKVFKNGFFEYSHKNYHGPLYFYVITASRWMLGDNIYALWTARGWQRQLFKVNNFKTLALYSRREQKRLLAP